jgi:crotonobetainyl-CoA:carnitine CoA-transferase CaiB-like acyl-CoA transferase
MSPDAGRVPTPLLDGMRVLDAGIWRPVPHATQLLADLGADVCKLEPPGGDPMRAFPDLFRDIASHKRSVTVDLRTDAGRQKVLELAAESDVFCEGWRPGVADRLGVGYDAVRAVNSSVVYCSISGYGQTGPLVQQAGHDLNYQALAGAVAPSAGAGGDAGPAIPRVPIADLAAGNVAAMLVCAAWAKRLQTGEGERIDVAMADVIASWVGPYASTAMRDRSEPVAGSPGYGVFRAADGGFVTLAVISEDHFWAAVCDALGIPELRALTYAERLDDVDGCNAAVADAVARLDRDDAVARLTRAGAPVAPVLEPVEAGRHEQFRRRGVFVPDDEGQVRTAFPARLSVHPVRPPGPAPAPGP